jgi:hypothetical protein
LRTTLALNLTAMALLALPLTLRAQDAAQQPPETGTILRVYVNAVLAPVVVRDAQGNSLKVEVDRNDVKIEAREGYFAPLPPKNKK